MVTARTEFSSALNQVCSERGIDPETVLETIKMAILAAYRKDFGGEIEGYEVELNGETGEAKIFKEKKDVTPPGFGRIAAQTAKQVILQRIREAEKKAILEEYKTRVGNIVNGMIRRFDGPNVIVDIGKTEGVMIPVEQIPNEQYRLNQRLVFYIEGIHEGMRGSEVVVSRAHKGLIEGLLAREVPEVGSGAVEVKLVAREPGVRSKVAVFSTRAGVDPVGSCVGQKGVRVQAVIAEIPQEKIDIIQWNEDPKQFLASALSPAKDVKVDLNEKEQIAKVIVPEDQLSLVIGKEGQNVRLAAKLTGWKIDVVGATSSEKEAPKEEAVKEEKTEKKEKKKKTTSVKKTTKKSTKTTKKKTTKPKKV